MLESEFDILQGQTDIFGNVAETTVIAGGDDSQEDGERTELFAGDTGTLPVEARKVLAALIRDSFISSSNRELWYVLERYEALIASRLADLFLVLDVRYSAGVAAARQAICPSVTLKHKLKGTQPLSAKSSVVLGYLAEHYYIAQANGHTEVFIEEEELIKTVEALYPPAGDYLSIKEKSRSGINELKEAGFLANGPDENYYQITGAIEFFDYEEARKALDTYRAAQQVEESDPTPRKEKGVEQPGEEKGGKSVKPSPGKERGGLGV